MFEKFRNRFLENYDKCPSHYLSVPALSWDAMFNMNNDLIPDVSCTFFWKR